MKLLRVETVEPPRPIRARALRGGYAACEKAPLPNKLSYKTLIACPARSYTVLGIYPRVAVVRPGWDEMKIAQHFNAGNQGDAGSKVP